LSKVFLSFGVLLSVWSGDSAWQDIFVTLDSIKKYGNSVSFAETIGHERKSRFDNVACVDRIIGDICFGIVVTSVHVFEIAPGMGFLHPFRNQQGTGNAGYRVRRYHRRIRSGK